MAIGQVSTWHSGTAQPLTQLVGMMNLSTSRADEPTPKQVWSPVRSIYQQSETYCLFMVGDKEWCEHWREMVPISIEGIFRQVSLTLFMCCPGLEDMTFSDECREINLCCWWFKCIMLIVVLVTTRPTAGVPSLGGYITTAYPCSRTCCRRHNYHRLGMLGHLRTWLEPWIIRNEPSIGRIGRSILLSWKHVALCGFDVLVYIYIYIYSL